jgi:hypothetical protein
MLEESELAADEAARPQDSYGDVALGVECAWPASIPALEADSISID